MKNSITLDVKSTLIGFLGAALLISIFGFNKATHESPGRYQASSSEEGIIILDTQNGNYIIDNRSSLSGKTIWTKGDFKDAYDKGINRATSKKLKGN